MKKESISFLLRIFIGESDKYKGQTTYQYLAEYLKKNKYAGVTVIRGIEGYGHSSKIHSTDLLDLSSDLPIIIEIVDTEEKIEALKKVFEETNMLGSGLITEERVKIIRYGKE
jgi:hypothetical protein